MTRSARLRGRLAKIVTMDWDEIRSRGGQALTQRVDMLRSRLGVPPAPRFQSALDRPPGRFFFDPDQVPGLVDLLRVRLPAECERIIDRAARVCRHRFDVLGYENLSFGDDIDWHLDPVSGRKAPIKPWYKVPFLDFDTVGDAKVTWELNRHQHWVILAKAYVLTGENRFVDEIAAESHHWWNQNPYAMGINWASALEVAFRSLSWLWVKHILSGSPALSRTLADELDRGLALNGRHLETYLSTHFSPNTHLLGEAVALFFIGLLVPDARGSGRWQRCGWRIILEQADRQVLEDGLHFERSAYYHVYALDFLLHARILAARNGISVPSELDQALARQLEVLEGISLKGTVFRFGDDDGGRVFDGARNRGDCLLDPLATGAALFGRPEFKAEERSIPEETIWLLGGEGVRRFDELSCPPHSGSSMAFQQSKLYVMAAVEPARKVLVVPGTKTELGGGHAHADLLSLQLALRDRLLLGDSGTFAYAGANGTRDRFRGTQAHSTLQVGNRSQGLPAGPFSWESLPAAVTDLWVSEATFDLLAAHHDGYGRLDTPLRHHRWIFSLRVGFVLVRDVVYGSGSHRLDLRWQVAAEARLLQTAVNTHVVHVHGRPDLALVTVADHGWDNRVERGWTSPVYGREEARPVLRFSREAVLPTEFATLMHPIVGDGDGSGILRRLGGRGPAGGREVSGYEYRTAGQSHFFFFASGGVGWQLFDWKSDASFLYCRLGPSLRHISEAIVVGGSYVNHGRHRHAAPDSPHTHWGWHD